LVEAVSLGSRRAQTEQQAALGHDDPAPEDGVGGIRFGIAGRRRLGRHVEAEELGVEAAAALDVRDRQPQVVDPVEVYRIAHLVLQSEPAGTFGTVSFPRWPSSPSSRTPSSSISRARASSWGRTTAPRSASFWSTCLRAMGCGCTSTPTLRSSSSRKAER